MMLSYVPYGKKYYYYHYYYSVWMVACMYHTKSEAEIPPESQFCCVSILVAIP
jgi:hypothetical protein